MTAKRVFALLRSFLTTRALGWTCIVVLLVLWQVSTSRGWIDRPELPPLSRVASKWWDGIDDGSLGGDLFATLRVMFKGYLLAAVIGISIGVLMGSFKPIYGLVEPFFEMLRPIPMTALVPLLILFLGIDDQLKVVTVLVTSINPIILNTFAGVRTVSRTMRDTGTTFGLSRFATIREILLPNALPSILVGLRLALSISMIIAVFAEMTAGNVGMGYRILRAQQTLSVDQLYAGIITLAIVGYVLNRLVLLIERAAIPWHASSARHLDR